MLVSVKWQEWSSNGNVMTHDYEPYDDKETVRKNRLDVAERFRECMAVFLKLPRCRRIKGMIYGGVLYNFLFTEVFPTDGFEDISGIYRVRAEKARGLECGGVPYEFLQEV